MDISPAELEKIPEPLRCNFTGEMDWWKDSPQAKYFILKSKILDFIFHPKKLSPEEAEQFINEHKRIK